MIRDPHLRTTLERVAQGSPQPEDLPMQELSDRSMAAALLNFDLIEQHLKRIADAWEFFPKRDEPTKEEKGK